MKFIGTVIFSFLVLAVGVRYADFFHPCACKCMEKK
jgi:hypothetical protein